MNKWYILAGGALIYGIVSVMNAWRKLRYSISDLRFSTLDITSGTVYLAFDFVIYNPTSVDLDVDTLDGDVMLEGCKIGEIHMMPMRTIYAKSITSIPVQVLIDSSEAISRIVDLLSYSTLQQWVASFVGSLGVAGHMLQVRYSYELKNL